MSHTRGTGGHLATVDGAYHGMIHPRRIIAIGRDAALALEGIDLPLHVVRHPSYGGQAEFVAGVFRIYGIVGELAPVTTLELPLMGGCGATETSGPDRTLRASCVSPTVGLRQVGRSLRG